MKKENRTETAKRFNVFDIIVILLVVVLIASFAYRIYAGVDKISGQAGAKYAIIFECDSEYNSLLKYINDGDAVYFEHDGVLLGYVYKGNDTQNGAVYEVTDMPVIEDDEMSSEADSNEADGETCEYKEIRIGGHIKLNADTVKAKNAGHYVIGDTNISKGSVINVYTEKASFTIVIKDVFIIE